MSETRNTMLKEMSFNGISSKELGLVIQEPPAFEYPEKDYEVQHIPGRSGDIVVNLGSYKNIKRTYNMVNVFSKYATGIYEWKPGHQPLDSNFQVRARAMTDWLMGANGYCRLEDDYEPDIYRKAMYYSEGNFTNIYDQATAAKLTFECMPQRFYRDGTTSHTYQYDEQEYPRVLITNTTNRVIYDTIPYIKITLANSQSGTLWINFSVSQTATQKIKMVIPTGTSIDNIVIDYENHIIGSIINNVLVDFSRYVSLYDGNDNPIYDFIELFKGHNSVELQVFSADGEILSGLTGYSALVYFNWWTI